MNLSQLSTSTNIPIHIGEHSGTRIMWIYAGRRFRWMIVIDPQIVF
jgi:hypothetical protein